MEKVEIKRGRSGLGSLIASLTSLVAVLGGMALTTPATREEEEEAEDLAAIDDNEDAAIAALRAIRSAQKIWRENDRDKNNVYDYTANYSLLYSFAGGGAPAALIRKEIAEARHGSNAKPYEGYLFCDITADYQGPYNTTLSFGVCAYPAEYDETGRHTFIIDNGSIDDRGVVYRKDLRKGAAPVTTFPNVRNSSAGWTKVPEIKTGSWEPAVPRSRR